MKILTRKQQDEILKMLSANLIVALQTEMSPEFIDKTISNIYDIAYTAAGIEGTEKVHNTVEDWYRRRKNERLQNL